ncbi:SWIM zinc finger family protein [Paenibacillus filicis]|uniref:SWIM zinc finger family protein n=1 Tax=Paenibacillus filicis TaxID=669464 RepID=A0ABU9DRI6_9BACL
MLKLQIPKNRISMLARYLRDYFDTEQIEGGWEDFHKRRVEDIELKHGLEIHALVRVTKPYEVILDLESAVRSQCSCPEGEHCRHKAAVFFALYVPYGRPELLLQQLKQAILVRQRQQQTRQTNRIAEKKQQERLEPPTPDQSPSLWQRFFDQQFYGFSMNQQQSIELFYSSAKDSLTPYAEAWEKPQRDLYGLHMLLFVMRKIEQFYTETKSSYLSYYIETGCKTVARQCHEELQERLPQIDIPGIARSNPAAWKETLALIGESALAAKESPLSWSAVYRSIWWKMAPETKWVSDERTRIRKLLNAPDISVRRKDVLQLAEAHFALMEEGDEAARRQLEGLTRKEPRDFFLYLHDSYRQEQWERMLAWLRWLLPLMQKAQQEDLRQFCQYWIEAVQRQPDDTEWVDVMVALLPRTYHFYTAYLMRAGRYQAWIDLQLANRVSPLNLFAPDLTKVENHDPSLVLPLYHQAVERCIAEKNRTAYQNAMRLLKKLNGIYTRLQRQVVWEDYVYRLAGKHARLRALQEELRRVKWIP